MGLGGGGLLLALLYVGYGARVVMSICLLWAALAHARACCSLACSPAPRLIILYSRDKRKEEAHTRDHWCGRAVSCARVGIDDIDMCVGSDRCGTLLGRRGAARRGATSSLAWERLRLFSCLGEGC